MDCWSELLLQITNTTSIRSRLTDISYLRSHTIALGSLCSVSVVLSRDWANVHILLAGPAIMVALQLMSLVSKLDNDLLGAKRSTMRD